MPDWRAAFLEESAPSAASGIEQAGTEAPDLDGIVQATGAGLLLGGELATRPGLVRNDEAVRVVPMRLGGGMGAGVVGGF